MGKYGKMCRMDNIVENTELNSTHEVDNECYNYKHEVVRYSKFFNSGIDNIKNIETDLGYSIKGNINHPVLCMNENLDIEWKLINDLNVGDVVLISKKNFNRFINPHIDSKDKDYIDQVITKLSITPCQLDKVMSSDMTYKKYFIRGLFSNHSKIYNLYNEEYDIGSTYIIYENSNHKIISQLQLILLNFGIVSYISDDEYMYKLIISDLESINSYNNHIGFNDTIKKNKLTAILEIMNSSEYQNDDIKRQPQIKYLNERILDNSKDKDVYKNPINSIRQFATNLKVIRDNMKMDAYYEINCKLDVLKDFITTSVSNITDIESEAVYSIKVDSEDHSFIANGFVNHNTEARLNKFTEEVLLDDLKSNSIDFIPNYDNTDEEPSVLPSKLPLILVNGAFGIAGGYTVSILPHNLNDVVDKTIQLLENPNISLDEFVDGFYPELPTGAIICNRDEITQAYKTGTGRMVNRCKIEHDEKKNRLIITEIPYMKSLITIKKSIMDAVNSKDIIGIKDIKDDSSKGKVRLILELKKGTDLNLIEQQLYKTQCQSTFHISFVGTKDDEFIEYGNIKQIVEEWITFRINTIKRIKLNHIRKYKMRIHLLSGLIIALDNNNIDRVIKIIKTGNSRPEVIESLMDTFGLTDIQVNHILSIKLYSLNKIQVDEVSNEIDGLNEKINGELEYFTDKFKIRKYIIDELNKIGKDYYKAKNAVITNIDTDKSNITEDIIADEEFLMVLTDKNFLKKIPSELKNQKKGGKGISIGKIKDGDVAKSVLQAHSKDNILLFSDSGKVYCYKCYELESTSLTSFGNNISILVNGENIVSMINITTADITDPNVHLLIATKLGKIKMVNLSEFKRLGSSGIIATRLNDNDQVITVEKVDITKEFSVLSVNSEGIAINFEKSDIPILLRPTTGSNIYDGSVIKDTTYISNVIIVTPETKGIILLTKTGLGKKVVISEFPVQRRGGKGRISIKLKEDTDECIKVIPYIDDENELIIISNTSIINVNTGGISTLLRPAYGNTVKKLKDGEFLLDACMIE